MSSQEMYGYTEPKFIVNPVPGSKLDDKFIDELVGAKNYKNSCDLYAQYKEQKDDAEEKYTTKIKEFIDFHRKYRTDMFSLVQNQIICGIVGQGKKGIIVHAPVKSGKRGFVQLTSSIMRLDDVKYGKYKEHLFVTSLVRVADKRQMDEMRAFGISTHCISSKRDVVKLLYKLGGKSFLDNTGDAKYEELVKEIEDEKNLQVNYSLCAPIVHIDESDYGTNEEGLLAAVWNFLASDHFKGHVVFYSATPYETIAGVDPHASQDKLEKYAAEIVKYNPPDGYCGASTFLDEKMKLVHEAEPFFENKNGIISFSEQGWSIIEGAKRSVLRDPKRNIIILRVTTSNNLGTGKDNLVIAKNLGKIAGIDDEKVSVFFHPSDTGKNLFKPNNKGVGEDVNTVKLIWDKDSKSPTAQDDIKKKWFTVKDAFPIDDGTKIYIYIIDQICARSTEIKFHDRIYAYHDYRNFETCAVSTMTQAQERVCHYATSYGGYFQPILVFGDVVAMNISAGEIGLLEANKILSHRVIVSSGRKRRVVSRFLEYTGKGYPGNRTISKEEYSDFVEGILEVDFKGDFHKDDFHPELNISKKLRGSYATITRKYKEVNGGEYWYPDEREPDTKESKWSYTDIKKRAIGVTDASAVRIRPCYDNDKFGISIMWFHDGFYTLNGCDCKDAAKKIKAATPKYTRKELGTMSSEVKGTGCLKCVRKTYKDSSIEEKYSKELDDDIPPTVMDVTNKSMYQVTFAANVKD